MSLVALVFLSGCEFGSLSAASFHEAHRNLMSVRILIVFQIQTKLANFQSSVGFSYQEIRLQVSHLQKAQRWSVRRHPALKAAP